MKPLIDADILRYEIGYAAEVGFRLTTGDEEAMPPFDYVEECLMGRLEEICQEVGATEKPKLFLSKGASFRDQIARRKEYKATRISKKPFHFANLTAYMEGVLNAEIVEGIEADDAIAIEHTADPLGTIICSRDKDLRQVPGMFYSWELGKQPSFGPVEITKEGDLFLDRDKKPPKLSGSGLAFFYAQCLMGDSVDNVPGLPGWGPVAAYNLLTTDLLGGELDPKARWMSVCDAFKHVYEENWERELLEQGQLLWMCRRFNPDGSPELWQLGQEE